VRLVFAGLMPRRARRRRDQRRRARCDLLAAPLADGTADRHPEVAELQMKLAREIAASHPLAVATHPWR